MLTAPQSIALRPPLPDDEAFLFEVYSASRRDDLAGLNWPSEQVHDFLNKQYAAQQRFFRADYPQAHELIVLRSDERIGRLMVERSDREIRLVDLALLPSHRNAGIGTHLIKELISEAKEAGKAFRVQVMRVSQAVNLFERLGFVKVSETGSHYQMEWRAAL